ncbi:S46 family peptidase [Rosistilla oblonga]|uniref:S46 family peptidase n=1 Tax=Rosistilla oblonga TaxID=2527990 RepID=UPI003A978BFD
MNKVSLVLAFLLSSSSFADEGMWLFNDLPNEYLRDRYSFKADDAWVKRLMQASVRLNSGGSGSFVSSDGLVLTNHHVASDTLHKLSTADRNLIEEGFLARSHEQELKAPDLELNQLVEIVDVSEKVAAAVTPAMSPEHAVTARRAVIAEIEKESLDRTGLRSDVVTLFGGAQYHLYRYKKYTDVRLVWAPETKIAFFGGDADNFEYPRYCMDATILRVYEQGKPAKIENFLPWSDTEIDEHELVFVSGHPGRTQRIFTVEALKYLRDHRLPYVLDYLRRKEVLMQQFGLRGKEELRRAQDELFGIQNSRKAYGGMLAGLQDPKTMQEKVRRQQRVLEAVRSKQPEAAAAWETIARLQQQRVEILDQTSGFRSRLYDLAETLVLMAAEDKKPNSERLPELRVSNRDSLLQDLLSTAPIYNDLEQVKLTDELMRLAERRGGDDPLVVEILDGKRPDVRAAELVFGTKVGDLETRKQFVEVGAPLIDKSEDPMILLARAMQGEYQRLRKIRDELDEQEKQAYTQITEASLAAGSTSKYPDATFTLRLAIGTIKGYSQNGVEVPAWTKMEGIFDYAAKHAGQEDYELPESWQRAAAAIPRGTPMNFVCTADIIGGNSGSPVVNRAGELVGLIFDGNIQSLTADYIYTSDQARAVSVSAAAIRVALEKIYGAPFLADQLGR